MARYTGPACKLCRREGEHLFIKGNKCAISGKCTLDKKGYAPGEHGRRRTKQSEYSLQLREKQKAKRIYGLLEKQFRNTYETASRQRGITGDNLLRLLETRLDNVIYRAGFTSSRRESRQFVGHGHIVVNGRKVNIPSFRVKPGQVIEVREKSKKMPRMIEITQGAIFAESPSWLKVDQKGLKITVDHLPARDEISSTIQDKLIVELYSK